MDSSLHLEKNGAIATLSLHDEARMNALNIEKLETLALVLDQIEADPEIRVVLIPGIGKAFVAGADIAEMLPLNANQGKNFGAFGAKVFRRIETMPKIFIALVNGFALGGGCELAMACDLRIASAKAKFGQPEVSLGITPGFSGTQRLPRLIGLGWAKELIFTGSAIDAAEAFRMGLVNHVVEPEALLDAGNQLALKILKNSFSAVIASKEAINLGLQCDAETAIKLESHVFGLCFATPDQKEGMAAFIDKRKPVFLQHK